ncbi:hypothetical protein D7252_04840 [Microbacterium sp. CGR2]|nr:hypothetical protein D7252_04840 [Microbacterium sp. CGR2]
MRTSVKRALWGTLIAGGITLFSATAANAAETSGDDGLLAGTSLDGCARCGVRAQHSICRP